MDLLAQSSAVFYNVSNREVDMLTEHRAHRPSYSLQLRYAVGRKIKIIEIQIFFRIDLTAREIKWRNMNEYEIF